MTLSLAHTLSGTEKEIVKNVSSQIEQTPNGYPLFEDTVAFLVWVRLKALATQTGQTIYQLKQAYWMTIFAID